MNNLFTSSTLTVLILPTPPCASMDNANYNYFKNGKRDHVLVEFIIYKSSLIVIFLYGVPFRYGNFSPRISFLTEAVGRGQK